MARTPEQSTIWAASFLKNKGGILDAEVIGAQTLQISRERFDPFTAGIISASRVTPELIPTAIRSDSNVSRCGSAGCDSVCLHGGGGGHDGCDHADGAHGG